MGTSPLRSVILELDDPAIPGEVIGDGGETPLSRMFALCNVEQSREYCPDRRSIRIHGHSTTIRLERAFWTVLDTLAEEENLSVAELITRIHDHCLTANKKNLASCLRVVCLKYINLCY